MATTITTKGLLRFRCIGSDCELTCCSGWTVTVDAPHRAEIERHLGATTPGRKQLEHSFLPTKTEKGESILRLLDNGDCCFLSETKLCSLQAQFGEPILPNTCAQYPRVLASVNGQPEQFGFLSCPEVARCTLLSEDGMELLAFDEQLTRPLHRKGLEDAGRPYHQPFDEIRAAGFALLSLRSFPIATRLFFLAYLGKRTAEFFHRDMKELDSKRLANELSRLRDPAILRQLAEGFGALKVPTRLAAEVVLGVLRARVDPNLGPVVAKVFDRLALGNPVPAGATQPERLWALYSERRSAWQTALPGPTDLYFENYAKNHWLRDWYTASPNLLIYVQTYLIQVAVARFLVYCHPALENGLAQAESAKREVFGRVVVEVISRVARALEHNAPFVRQIEKSFADQGMQDFPHTTVLAGA